MRLLSVDETVDILQKSMDLFDINWKLEVVFDPPDIPPDTIAYYSPALKRFGFRSNYIPEPVVYHEFFHMLADYYGFNLKGEDEEESFARVGEALWLRTKGDILNFKCDVCGSSKISITPTGTIKCLVCGSEYTISYG